MAQIGIFDGLTGQNEIMQIDDKDFEAWKNITDEQIQLKNAEIVEKKLAAQAKLAALGLTADDLKALGL